jgi:hypothetical protein
VCDSLEPIAPATQTALYIGDLSSGKLTMITGSEGLVAPRWSPDGRYIAALRWPESGERELMVFDFRSGRWQGLATVRYPTYPEWSHNGRYIYFQDVLGDQQPIMRIEVATRKATRVVGFGADLGNPFLRAGLLAIDADDLPVIRVSRNLADIYSLELHLP